MSRAEQEPIPTFTDWSEAKPDEPIDYRYLDLDTETFCKDAKELAERMRYKHHLCRVIPAAVQYNQILVVAGQREFSTQEAIHICRVLTGILPK